MLSHSAFLHLLRPETTEWSYVIYNITNSIWHSIICNTQYSIYNSASESISFIRKIIDITPFHNNIKLDNLCFRWVEFSSWYFPSIYYHWDTSSYSSIFHSLHSVTLRYYQNRVFSTRSLFYFVFKQVPATIFRLGRITFLRLRHDEFCDHSN